MKEMKARSVGGTEISGKKKFIWFGAADGCAHCEICIDVDDVASSRVWFSLFNSYAIREVVLLQEN